MSRWTIDKPTTLDFDGAVALKATLVAGSICVLATDDKPSVRVAEVTGPPVTVSHEAGMLSITHENLWEGVLQWLSTQRQRSAQITVSVPRDCPVQLNLITADAVITGMGARVSIRSGAGDVTLDGVAGRIDANTVSGVIEAQGLDGAVSFTSVSGDLALAGGTIDRLTARSVSGRIAADVDLMGDSRVQINTVSGEVSLRLSQTTSAEVAITSTAGRIDTSFLELARHEKAVAKSMTGKLGDGSGRLTVNTVSGGVTLLGRPDDTRIRMEDD